VATNDTISNATQFAVPGGTVESSPIARSKKAKTLDMSTKHRFGTSYTLTSVMNGWRGDKSENHSLSMNGREQISMSETAKKGKFGPTQSHDWGGVGHSTPPWGAVVRA
jgi:hypothetical protein